MREGAVWVEEGEVGIESPLAWELVGVAFLLQVEEPEAQGGDQHQPISGNKPDDRGFGEGAGPRVPAGPGGPVQVLRVPVLCVHSCH